MRREALAWTFAFTFGISLWLVTDYIVFGKGWIFIELWKELAAQ